MPDRVPVSHLPAAPPFADEDLDVLLVTLGYAPGERPEHLMDHLRWVAADLLREWRSGKIAAKLAEEAKAIERVLAANRELHTALAALDRTTVDLMPHDDQQRVRQLAGADGDGILAALDRMMTAAAQDLSRLPSGPGSVQEKRREFWLADIRVYAAFEAAKVLAGHCGAASITGSANGLLAQVTEALWRLATGREDDDLARYVAAAAKAGRAAGEAMEARCRGDHEAGVDLDNEARRLLRSLRAA